MVWKMDFFYVLAHYFQFIKTLNKFIHLYVMKNSTILESLKYYYSFY